MHDLHTTCTTPQGILTVYMHDLPTICTTPQGILTEATRRLGQTVLGETVLGEAVLGEAPFGVEAKSHREATHGAPLRPLHPLHRMHELGSADGYSADSEAAHSQAVIDYMIASAQAASWEGIEPLTWLFLSLGFLLKASRSDSRSLLSDVC